MPRMRPLVWAVLACISVGIVVLWGRSYLVEDRLFVANDITGGRNLRFVASAQGWIRFAAITRPDPMGVGTRPWTWEAQPISAAFARWDGVYGTTPSSSWYIAGFGFVEGDDDPRRVSTTHGMPYRVVVIPFWSVCLADATFMGLLLVPWWRSTRQAKRRSKGLCARCGYDMRGSVSQCPECGLETRQE